MIPSLRQQYNRQFTKEKFDAYDKDLHDAFPGQLDFRVAETPVFVPYHFWQKIHSACESIVDIINTAEYHKQSEKAIPAHLRVPNEDSQPQFIVFDFGICQNEA